MAESITDSLWRGNAPLVLASKSATRAALLASAGLFAEVVAPDVDERILEMESGELNPAKLAVHLARAKAMEVAKRKSGRIVIGADQVLGLDGLIFHKPADLTDARNHLTRLQGRTHTLYSAVTIVRDGMADVFYDTARLTMRSLDFVEIASYISLAGETRVISSVGAYQLEGFGIHLFSRIEGDHSTVLGLPLLPLLARLRIIGLLAL